jgi:hypothetical protein
MGLVRGWSGWTRSGGYSAGACRWCPCSRPLPSVLTRPLTDATARRPQPRSCASGQRRRTRRCQHRQNGIPHHPKVAGGVARSRPGRSWALPVLRGRISRVSGPAVFGDEAKPLPVWAEPATSLRPADQQAAPRRRVWHQPAQTPPRRRHPIRQTRRPLRSHRTHRRDQRMALTRLCVNDQL